MITVVTGRPGGGKSLFAMRELLREVRLTRRMIVTNLSVDVGRVNEYLQETEPAREYDATGRILVLTEDETREFYLQRNKWRTAEVAGAAMQERQVLTVGKDKIPDLRGVQDDGVLYIIDEAHLFYNARLWATAGRGVGHYVSQHRKLGDDVLLVTQHLEKLDKQLRLDVGRYCVCQNRKQTARRIRLPGEFRVAHFDFQPGHGNAEPDRMETYKLDAAGVASCYRTGAGVGVAGTVADTQDKGRALPATYWLVLFGAIALGVCVLFLGLGKGASVVSSKVMDHALGGPGRLSTNVVASPGVVHRRERERVVEPLGRQRDQGETNEVYVVGVARIGKMRVMLSDGRTVTEDDPRLERVGADWVEYDGRRYVEPTLAWRRQHAGDRPAPSGGGNPTVVAGGRQETPGISLGTALKGDAGRVH